jgi:amino acid transporter
MLIFEYWQKITLLVFLCLPKCLPVGRLISKKPNLQFVRWKFSFLHILVANISFSVRVFSLHPTSGRSAFYTHYIPYTGNRQNFRFFINRGKSNEDLSEGKILVSVNNNKSAKAVYYFWSKERF